MILAKKSTSMIASPEKPSNRKIAAGIIFLSAARLLNAGIALFGLVLIARRFGANIGTDVFFMAQLVPTIVGNLGKVVVNISFIPAFTEALHEESEEGAWRFASNSLNIFIVGTVALAGVYLGLAATVLRGLTFLGLSRVQGVTSEFMFLTLLILPIIVLNPLFGVWESISFSKKDYVLCGIASLFVGTCELLSIILLSDRFGLTVVVIAISVGYLLQLLVVLPKFRDKRKYFGLSLSFRYPRTNRIFTLMLPALYGVCLSQILVASDWLLASTLGEGRVTALICATRLAYFVPGFFALSAIIPLLGKFSEFIVQEDDKGLKGMMLQIVKLILLMIIPFCVWLAIMSRDLTEVLYARGQFSAEATEMVRSMLFLMVPAIFFLCMSAVFRQVLLAMRRIRFVLAEGTSFVILHILLSAILMRYMGVAGIAAGTSIAAVCDTAVLIYYFRKEKGGFEASGTVLFLSKILFASSIMGIGIWMLSVRFGGAMARGGNIQHLIYLVSIAVAGGLLFLVLAVLFRVLSLKQPLKMLG